PCVKADDRQRITDVIVGPRVRRDVGDLTALAASIREHGLLHPIVITPQGRLVAGFRRLEACRQLGWTEVGVHVVELDDLLRAEHDENTLRKDFTPSEAVAIARALEEREREQAKARTVAAHASPGKFPELEAGRVRDRLGACVGMSGRTLEKAAAVVGAAERAPETYQALVDEMDATGRVDPVYRRLKALERGSVAPRAAERADAGRWSAHALERCERECERLRQELASGERALDANGRARLVARLATHVERVRALIARLHAA